MVSLWDAMVRASFWMLGFVLVVGFVVVAGSVLVGVASWRLFVRVSLRGGAGGRGRGDPEAGWPCGAC